MFQKTVRMVRTNTNVKLVGHEEDDLHLAGGTCALNLDQVATSQCSRGDRIDAWRGNIEGDRDSDVLHLVLVRTGRFRVTGCRAEIVKS